MNTFENDLLEQAHVLTLLLEQTDDEQDAKYIRDMLIGIATYLNSTVED